ncbi:MAG: C25 family cysteine peptidase, partial [Planctomycetota bacterium]
MKTHAKISSLIVIIMVLAASNVTMGAEGTISVLVHADSYETGVTNEGHEISVDDFGRLQIPGKPALPSRIFAIAVPPGAEVTDVHFFPEASTVLPGTFRIPPVPMAGIMSHEDFGQAEYEANRRSVYNSDETYPSMIGEVVRSAGYRKYNLVDVRITPFSYRPKSGKLIHHPKIKVDVLYTLPEKTNCSTVKDNLPRTEAIAREIILNYEQAQSYHLDSQPAQSRGLHDYVIITLPSLTTAVQPLVDWETSKNRNVKVVTTTWIAASYTGYDLSERMRNFLRDKYPSQEWGIEDVLLVGTYNDVPMRLVWQDVGYGKPRTDYYYAELSLPDSESWDMDGDFRWAEDEDPIDFYTEVNVSRIPWSDAATVMSICNKSVLYEQNNDPAFKKNILLLGAFAWPDTDEAVLMEIKADQPWMSSWSSTRMYEKNSSYWSTFPCDYNLIHANVMSVLPTGKYAFVNYAGHGSPTSCHILGHGQAAFITAADSEQLSNEHPAIMFANACSNSDPNHVNIGMKMMKQGAVGFLGSTCVAYGLRKWDDPYDGNSSSLDYFFTTRVTSNDFSIAGAHQWSLRHMYTHGVWVRGPAKYQIPGWGALAGNPNLRMGSLPALIIDYDEESVETYMPPGPETVINIKIRPGAELYAPGTGLLCFRFDPGDAYTDVPLTPLGGDLFEAVIPATRPGDEPQFYFSAQTTVGSTVYYPKAAPAEVLSFDVC